MKKEMLSIMVPCLVVCALAFIDVDYQSLGVLDIISMVCAGIAALSIGAYWLKHKEG